MKTTRQVRSTPLALILATTATAITIALSGCSGSTGQAQNSTSAATPAAATVTRSEPASGSSPTAAGATSGGGGPATAPASTPAGGSPAPVDVCSVIPAEAASAATGLSFTSASESDLAKGVYSCTYTGDSLHWSIAVYQSPSTQTLDDLVTDLGGTGNAQPVTGIGDKAFVSPVAVAAMFGNRYIEVGSPFNDEANEAGYQALAKAAIAALQ